MPKPTLQIRLKCHTLRGRAAAIHGDMDQHARMGVLGEFKRGEHHVLVATDVAARGLDIKCDTFSICPSHSLCPTTRRPCCEGTSAVKSHWGWVTHLWQRATLTPPALHVLYRLCLDFDADSLALRGCCEL